MQTHAFPGRDASLLAFQHLVIVDKIPEAQNFNCRVLKAGQFSATTSFHTLIVMSSLFGPTRKHLPPPSALITFALM